MALRPERKLSACQYPIETAERFKKETAIDLGLCKMKAKPCGLPGRGRYSTLHGNTASVPLAASSILNRKRLLEQGSKQKCWPHPCSPAPNVTCERPFGQRPGACELPTRPAPQHQSSVGCGALPSGARATAPRGDGSPGTLCCGHQALTAAHTVPHPLHGESAESFRPCLSSLGASEDAGQKTRAPEKPCRRISAGRRSAGRGRQPQCPATRLPRGAQSQQPLPSCCRSIAHVSPKHVPQQDGAFLGFPTAVVSSPRTA